MVDQGPATDPPILLDISSQGSLIMRVKIRLRLEGKKQFHMNPGEEAYLENLTGKDT